MGNMMCCLVSLDNKKENKAVDKTASKASKVMHYVLTNYVFWSSLDYINVYFISNKLNKSAVENISISSCFLNAFSSDQIGVLFSAKDNAKYGSSLVSSPCGNSLLACFKNDSYMSSENVSMLFCNMHNKKSKVGLSILEYFNIPSLLLDNSSITNEGDINLHPLFNNSSINCLLTESDLKNENKIEASTINLLGIFEEYISYKPCFLATLFFNSSASLFTCSSVNPLSFSSSSAIANSALLINCSTNLVRTNLNLSLNSSGTSTFMDISAIRSSTASDYKSLSFGNVEKIQ